MSDEGGVILALRPAEMLRDPKMRAILEKLGDIPMIAKVRNEFGIDLNDVEQIILGVRIPTSSEIDAGTTVVNHCFQCISYQRNLCSICKQY